MCFEQTEITRDFRNAFDSARSKLLTSYAMEMYKMNDINRKYPCGKTLLELHYFEQKSFCLSVSIYFVDNLESHE